MDQHAFARLRRSAAPTGWGGSTESRGRRPVQQGAEGPENAESSLFPRAPKEGRRGEAAGDPGIPSCCPIDAASS